MVDEEFDAAMTALGTEANIPTTPYYVESLRADNNHRMILRQCIDRSNVPATLTASALIDDFKPEFLLLVGTAGGIGGRDNLALGDVVVADYINYAEFSKLSEGNMALRHLPYDHPSIFLRDSIAKPLRRTQDWKASITLERPDGQPNDLTKVLFGNIVAGEKILGDPDNAFQRDVLNMFDKALAVDMESMGFAEAVTMARNTVHYNPQFLVIRGISDLVDQENNDEVRQKWRRYACQSAAAFASSVASVLCEMAN